MKMESITWKSAKKVNTLVTEFLIKFEEKDFSVQEIFLTLGLIKTCVEESIKIHNKNLGFNKKDTNLIIEELRDMFINNESLKEVLQPRDEGVSLREYLRDEDKNGA